MLLNGDRVWRGVGWGCGLALGCELAGASARYSRAVFVPLGGPMRRNIPSIFLPIFIMGCSVATMFSQPVSPVLFRVAPAYGVGPFPTSVAVGDLNGAGKPDLAVAGNGVDVLLCNGDGTFQAAVNYAAGPKPASVAVGGFTGVSKPALAVADSSAFSAKSHYVGRVLGDRAASLTAD